MNNFGHFNASEEALAYEMWEFRTCQRSDGSYYGTGGQCRKGTETDKTEKEDKKPKPLSSEGVESLLGKKLNKDIDDGMTAVGMMDDFALDLYKRQNPEDAKKMDKYDDMIYNSDSPINTAISQARAEQQASQNTIALLENAEKAEEARGKVFDKFSKDPEKYEKEYDLKILEAGEARQALADEVAKFDPKMRELQEKLAKEDKKLDKYETDDPRWDKQYEKYDKAKTKINDRAEQMATNTPASRKMDKQLDDRVEKLEKTKESVRDRFINLENKANDWVGTFTWNDLRTLYEVSRDGDVNTPVGRYEKDLTNWTNQTYRKMKAAGYDVKKSDIKTAVEDTLLSSDWTDGSWRKDQFLETLSDLTN